MCNIDQHMCDELKVPSLMSTMLASILHYPLGMYTSIFKLGGLPEEVRLFKGIMQRIVFSARFEDATPSKCEIKCTWYEHTQKAESYVVFDGQAPRI